MWMRLLFTWRFSESELLVLHFATSLWIPDQKSGGMSTVMVFLCVFLFFQILENFLLLQDRIPHTKRNVDWKKTKTNRTAFESSTIRKTVLHSWLNKLILGSIYRSISSLRVFKWYNSPRAQNSDAAVMPLTGLRAACEHRQLSLSLILWFLCLTWFTVSEDCGITTHGTTWTRTKNCYICKGKTSFRL